jgi:hypothetical protein
MRQGFVGLTSILPGHVPKAPIQCRFFISNGEASSVLSSRNNNLLGEHF